MNSGYSTVLTTSGDFTAAGIGTAELEVSVGEGLCFYRYRQQIVVQVMSIFDSFIDRQGDIYSYSVTVTVTAGGFFLAKKLQNDDDDDDDDDETYDERIISYQRCMNILSSWTFCHLITTCYQHTIIIIYCISIRISSSLHNNNYHQ